MQTCVFVIRHLHIPLQTIPPPRFSSPEHRLRDIFGQTTGPVSDLFSFSCLHKQCFIWLVAGAKLS